MIGIRYFVYENQILPANRLKNQAMAGFYSEVYAAGVPNLE
jgi:hypothetical protein